MRGRRSWVAGVAAGLAPLAAGCARTPDRSAAPETPGQLIIDRIDTGSPLGRAGLEVGDVLVGARQGQVRVPVRGFADLWLLEVEYAPRGEVVLELARRGAPYERTVSEERWRTTVRPALAESALALHREAQAAVAGARPADAIAAYERLRDSTGDAALRAWASARAAQVQRTGSPAHWERAAAAAREARDESLEAWIAQRLCESLAETGAYAGAPARCEHARDVRLRLGQPLAAAVAEYRLAVIAGRRGNPREEERLHRIVLAHLAPIAPEGLLAVRTLRGLAKSRATQGDIPGAFENSRRSLALVARRAPRGLDHASSMMNLGIFHWFAGEWQTAETRFHEALDLAQSIDPDDEDVPNVLANLGVVANSRGDLVGAEEYFRRGLDSFVRRGAQDPLAASRTLLNMADMATKRGDLDSAIRYDREVLELRERIVPGSIDVASILASLGNHLIAAGQLEEGERHLERALALQRHHAPNSGDVAATLATLAQACRRRGDAARAEALAAEAVEISGRVGPRSELEAQTLRTLAEVRAERGQTADAERLLRRSAALLQTLLPGTLEQARTLHALGRLLRASGRREEALEPLRGAAAALDRQLATLGGTDEVRARFRESWRHIYRDLADLLLELGRKDEAFETLERSRARAFLLLLRSRDLQLTAGVSPDIERERRALAKAYDEVQEKLAERLAVHDEAGVRKLESDRRSLQLRRDQLAERLGRDAPRLAGLEAVSGLAEVRAALAGSAAALSYFVDEKRTRLAVVGAKGQTEILDLPVGETELRDMVDRFRFLLEARSPASDPSVLGARLYELLIAPAGPLLEGAPSLLLVPDGPLHRLPFAALVDGGPEGHGRFLVERTSVQLAASITAWIELRRGRRGAAGRFVAFADPVLPDVRRMARRLPSEELARLPYSRQEAEHLATLFPPSARVLEGSAASESAARGVGDGVRVLHFATHGLVDPVSPLDSALVLAPDTDASGRRDDGLLQAWEVVQDLRLDADLVALSACESGSGAAVADEGLIGLTRAFHFAGARAVLASLWKVYDRSTSILMERFYTHWAAGRSKAEALRAAQLDMIHDGARPAQWAAFELHGDGR